LRHHHEQRRALTISVAMPQGLRERPARAGPAEPSVRQAILDRAAALPDPGLRALDAIHLASAELTPGITTVLVYDKKLAAAARKMRMTVASPA
jgi:uncharacterized protein